MREWACENSFIHQLSTLWRALVSALDALASPGLNLERTSHSCLCLAQTCAEMIRATVDDYGTACSLLQNHAQTVCCVRMCVCACVICQGMLGLSTLESASIPSEDEINIAITICIRTHASTCAGKPVSMRAQRA